MTLTSKQRSVLIVTGVLIALVAMPVMASLSNPVSISNGVTFTSADGPSVTMQDSYSVDGENIFDDANTVNVSTVNNGQIKVSSNGDASLRVTQIEGTWTNIDNADVANNDVTINPSDKLPATIGGGVYTIAFRNPTSDDGSYDFAYGASGQNGKVAVNGLAPNSAYAAVDASTHQNLGFNTSDGNGRIAFDSLDTGSHEVLIQEGDSPPQLTDPDPQGAVSGSPNSISVNVIDDDFPNDNVTVEFFIDGSSVGTDSVTSEGRASVSISDPGSGGHTARAVATDSFGQQTELEWVFGVPSTFYVRNSTSPNQLVDDRQVDVTFYPEDSDTVYNRTTSDGTVDMSGLPTTDFIVSANADGYNPSTIYIPTITSQQSIYLTNENESTVEVRFVLEDETGTFGIDSRLNVKRAVTQNGSNMYRTVVSDEFGVEGVTTTLIQDERYRLEIVNRDGVVQSIGPYRADVPETVTIRPSEATITIDSYDRGWAAEATRDSDTIIVRYDDPQNVTDRVDVTIHERNNPNNLLTGSDTFIGQNEIDISYTITGNDTDREWVVDFEVQRNGETFNVTRYTTERPDSVFGGLGDVWRTIFGVAAMLIFGGIFSVLNRAVGGIMVGLVGGILWWTGWLSGATTGMAIAIYLMIAVLYTIHVNRV